jgi:hypothetical protein
MLASFYGLLLQVRLKTLLGLPILLRKSPHIEEPSGFLAVSRFTQHLCCRHAPVVDMHRPLSRQHLKTMDMLLGHG